jgi:predicted double-glycine peptidase
VQRYGLRVFNPLRNVDDTYYSLTDPNTGLPTISNIHLAKVAIRLYINLYTTSDGRPPRNIQLNFVSQSIF